MGIFPSNPSLASSCLYMFTYQWVGHFKSACDDTDKDGNFENTFYKKKHRSEINITFTLGIRFAWHNEPCTQPQDTDKHTS